MALGSPLVWFNASTVFNLIRCKLDAGVVVVGGGGGGNGGGGGGGGSGAQAGDATAVLASSSFFLSSSTTKKRAAVTVTVSKFVFGARDFGDERYVFTKSPKSYTMKIVWSFENVLELSLARGVHTSRGIYLNTSLGIPNVNIITRRSD